MLVDQVTGNIYLSPTTKTVDWLVLDWYETGKRILHKSTIAGRELQLRFFNGQPALSPGDILWEDDALLIAVDIAGCDAISIKPRSMFEMAAICYEIGNKHLPLFYEHEELLVAFEPPLFRLLENGGYMIKREERKLVQPIRTTVTPHSNMLFDKNMIVLKSTGS